MLAVVADGNDRMRGKRPQPRQRLAGAAGESSGRILGEAQQPTRR